MDKHLHFFPWERGFREPKSASSFRLFGNLIRCVLGVMLFMWPVAAPVLCAQSGAVQFIHVAEGESLDMVDVYINKERVVNDLMRNAATPFLTGLPIQIGFPVEITLAPATSSSAAEGFFTSFAALDYDGRNTCSIVGNLLNGAGPLSVVTQGGWLAAGHYLRFRKI